MLLGFLAGAILICRCESRAQDSPFGAIGRVQGTDISCENGTPATGITSTVGQSIFVSNGTVVTVHSGQALLTLFAGGQVDVCGPAKFTVLLSGDAITLALNFGRVRLELPANTVLRIFTPTVIGTPIDISGGSRDVTVGLSLDDSLCVRATSGAIQLEHQFTGEKLIVPQAGEFFLNAGRLLPVAGTPGSCQCTPTTIIPAPPPAAAPPEYAIAANPRPAPQPAPDPAPVTVDPAPSPVTKPAINYSMLAKANEAHPVSSSGKKCRATHVGARVHSGSTGTQFHSWFAYAATRNDRGHGPPDSRSASVARMGIFRPGGCAGIRAGHAARARRKARGTAGADACG